MMPKKWVMGFLTMFLLTLLAMGGVVGVVDPWFHYHAPLDGLAYRLDNERYQNDGILRQFSYDTVIAGTSMTRNFRTSELDELFQVHAVKVPYPAGYYKEINAGLVTAAENNEELKMIVRGLDTYQMFLPADALRYEKDSYPWYLYDHYLLNDIPYLLNKTVLFNEVRDGVIAYTRSGKKTTSFDDYGSSRQWDIKGKENVYRTYEAYYSKEERIGRRPNEIFSISQKDYTTIQKSISQNVTDLADAYPDVEYYIFFPPYSILWWDVKYQNGELKKYLDGEKYVIELLLQHENIHLFSFFTDFDLICNLDNYCEIQHYDSDINSQILLWMRDGHGQITKDNYRAYCEKEQAFYLNYDYDELFSDEKDHQDF